MIKAKSRIIVNDKLITAQFKYNPANERHIQTMTGGHKITGQLIADEDGSGGLDVHVKGILVMHLTIDPNRAFTGWVNCDVLPLDITRNGFRIEEKTYREFMSRMQDEAKNFKKKDIEGFLTTSQVLRSLLDMMNKYLKENNYLPSAIKLTPDSKGDEETPQLQQNEEGLQQIGEGLGDGSEDPGTSATAIQTDKLQPASERKHRGLHLVPTNDGVTRPAIYWLSSWPIDIYINQTHPLTLTFFAQRKRGKNLVAMRYFARIAVQINPQTSRLSDEEKFVEEDKIYLEFLTRAKIAGDRE